MLTCCNIIKIGFSMKFEKKLNIDPLSNSAQVFNLRRPFKLQHDAYYTEWILLNESICENINSIDLELALKKHFLKTHNLKTVNVIGMCSNVIKAGLVLLLIERLNFDRLPN